MCFHVVLISRAVLEALIFEGLEVGEKEKPDLEPTRAAVNQRRRAKVLSASAAQWLRGANCDLLYHKRRRFGLLAPILFCTLPQLPAFVFPR